MSAGARFDECLAAASLRKAFQTLGNLPVGEKGGWGGRYRLITESVSNAWKFTGR